MNNIVLIPELNYWMIQILKNSPVTDTYHKIPSTISDFWRHPNSVIELLFNENFNPEPWTSSSSSAAGIEAENERPYIYRYRTCNLLLIPDKNVLKRLQTYRWHSTVYAANSNKFLNYFDETGTHYPPTQNNSDIVYDSGLDYLEASSNTTPTLPVDVAEKDRSPYITYTTKNMVTGTDYPLIKHGAQTMRPYPPEPPIPVSHNVFELTDDDLAMLDLLFTYKTTGSCPVFNTIKPFNDLIGCIAKLVYIYLEAFCLNSFEHFDSEDPLCDGSDILCTLYEKHVLDMIYHLKARQYGVIYKQSNVVNTTIVEDFLYQFMIMKKDNLRIILTEEMILNGEVILSSENLPWDKRDFILYKDGLILIADEDYTLVLDFTDPTNVIAKIVFLKNTFVSGENLEFIWSYLDPYSYYSADPQDE